jgi:hypothetical protein
MRPTNDLVAHALKLVYERYIWKMQQETVSQLLQFGQHRISTGKRNTLGARLPGTSSIPHANHTK